LERYNFSLGSVRFFFYFHWAKIKSGMWKRQSARKLINTRQKDAICDCRFFIATNFDIDSCWYWLELTQRTFRDFIAFRLSCHVHNLDVIFFILYYLQLIRLFSTVIWIPSFILGFLYCASFQYKKWRTNWCHCFHFIHISTDLYMFRAHLPIFRRIHTAVPTSIGSVSVPFWLCVLYVVEIRR